MRACSSAAGWQPKTAKALCGAWLLTLLGACGGDTQELQAWMEQQRRDAKPNAQPLSAPKKFDPAPYDGGQLVDPFSTQKLNVALKQEAKQPNSLLASELNRRAPHCPPSTCCPRGKTPAAHVAGSARTRATSWAVWPLA